MFRGSCSVYVRFEGEFMHCICMLVCVLDSV